MQLRPRRTANLAFLLAIFAVAALKTEQLLEVIHGARRGAGYTISAFVRKVLALIYDESGACSLCLPNYRVLDSFCGCRNGVGALTTLTCSAVKTYRPRVNACIIQGLP